MFNILEHLREELNKALKKAGKRDENVNVEETSLSSATNAEIQASVDNSLLVPFVPVIEIFRDEEDDKVVEHSSSHASDCQSKIMDDNDAGINSGFMSDGEEKTDDDKSGTAIYRRGIYFTVFFIGVFLILYVVGAVIFFNKPQKSGHPYTCRTSNCNRMARWIKSAMDTSVQPCNDFYQYACGAYIKTHSSYMKPDRPMDLNLYREGIPINFRENQKAGNLLKKVDSYPENQILPFYQACIDTNRRDKLGMTPIVNLFAQIRVLYFQSGAYFSIISRFNVARVMGRIYRRIDRLFFIDIDGIKDNTIHFKSTKPPQEIILTPPKVYAEAMRKVWRIMGKDLMVEEDEIETIVYLVMRFEAELGLIQSKETATYIFDFPVNFDVLLPPPKKFHSNYIRMRGRFEWEELVAAIMGYPPGEYKKYAVTFNMWSSFHSQQDRYYALYLQDKLRNTPAYVIFRYFQWGLIKNFAFDLNNEVQDIMLPIFRTMGRNIIERCFASVFSNLHVLAAHRYKMMIDDTISAHRNMTAITDKILKTYSETISKLDLPIVMKASLLTTGKTLKLVLSDPESKLGAHMSTFYKGLNISEDHFYNVIQARSIKARNQISFTTKTPPFDMWWNGDYSLTEVTETSIPHSQSTTRYFNVPYGALLQPFLGNDLPILNYAGFGHYLVSSTLMNIAIHDLFQIYDANLRTWENKQEMSMYKSFQKSFLEMTECVIKTQSGLRLRQYPDLKANIDVREARVRMVVQTFSYELTTLVIHHMLDATLAKKGSVSPFKSPMEELLRGNKLIAERFPKYQVLPGMTKYSPSQIFFLALARHQCETLSKAKSEARMRQGPRINEIMIQASFRNLKEFADAWNCPKNSYMNPSKKCTLLHCAKEKRPKESQEDDLLNNETIYSKDDDSRYYDYAEDLDF